MSLELPDGGIACRPASRPDVTPYLPTLARALERAWTDSERAHGRCLDPLTSDPAEREEVFRLLREKGWTPLLDGAVKNEDFWRIRPPPPPPAMPSIEDPDRFLNATYRRRARERADLLGEPAATELRAALEALGQQAWRLARIAEGSMCPRCGSPSPERHPAVQYGGEVEPCPHPWHHAP